MLSPPGFRLLLTLNEPSRSTIRRLAWSPDGNRLATGGLDALVRLWDSATGQQTLTLSGHTRTVHGVAWSPDGTRLASVSRDGTLRFWDTALCRLLRVVSVSKEWLLTVAWSPDGRFVATAGESARVDIWDAQTGDRIRLLEEPHVQRPCAVAWSPNSRWLASGANEGSCRVWEPATGEVFRQFQTPHVPVYAVAWSFDGAMLATAGLKGDIQLHSWPDLTGKPLGLLEGHGSQVTDLSWDKTGALLCSVSWDDTVRLWDVGARRQVAALTEQSGRHFHSGVAFSPDGRRLATLGEEGHVVAFMSGELDSLPGHQSGSPEARLPDNKAPEENSACRRTAPRTGDIVCSGHTGWVPCVTFLRDGATVVSGDAVGILRFWNADTGQILRQLSLHTDVIDAVVVSPDGRWLATASWDGNSPDCFRQWRGGKQASGGQRRKGPLCCLGIPGTCGSLLGSDDGSVQVWDPDSGST